MAELVDKDPTAAERKADHLELAFQSQTPFTDDRFDYEPLMAAHPGDFPGERSFLNKNFRAPIWVSSMTGGTGRAGMINRNLARACGEFGMGMGLGSCRSLLHDSSRLEDFDVRDEIGEDAPLYANLGIAQIDQSIASGEVERILAMLSTLRVDGLIIHVNPLQEWFQPEGDKIQRPPIEIIENFIEYFEGSVIVKEVGQGMGPRSLEALFRLPIDAVEFAAHGGTNFSQLEMLRGTEGDRDTYKGISSIGHSAVQMVKLANQTLERLGDQAKCRQIIASGGVKNFLDGYYLVSQLNCPAVYGQGSAFLRAAEDSYEAVKRQLTDQIRGYALAEAYLRPRS
jgi:isopentenyl-diphosphate delta-isomerase